MGRDGTFVPLEEVQGNLHVVVHVRNTRLEACEKQFGRTSAAFHPDADAEQLLLKQCDGARGRHLVLEYY